MKNAKKIKDGKHLLRAKTVYNNVSTHYEDICSITAIRMALENYLGESAEFDNPQLYLQRAISGVNDCISCLGYKIVKCED